jgi:hypothetical protein
VDCSLQVNKKKQSNFIGQIFKFSVANFNGSLIKDFVTKKMAVPLGGGFGD